jgi:hypothetical protein
VQAEVTASAATMASPTARGRWDTGSR